MKNKTITKSDMPKAIAWFASVVDSLKEGKKYDVEIKEHREKRSLDANAYCWVLIDKLAARMHYELKQDHESVKEQIYRQAILDIGGVSYTHCVPNKDVEDTVRDWLSRGLGWQAEVFPSKIEGCTNVTLYRGSSVYNKAQMARLIDNIIQDCKAVGGIETMPPHKLKGLIEEWK